jgi:hypothetical protein
MEWQPIETAPEKTDILTYAEWGGPSIGTSSYEWVERVREEVEHETTNAKGRRRILQEISYKEREWSGAHWEPTHWMPLPPPPSL